MKKIVSLLIVACLMVGMLAVMPISIGADAWDGTVADGFAGGDGSEATPWLIETEAQWEYFAQRCDNGDDFSGKYIKLMNDLTFNEGDASTWATTAPENMVTPAGHDGGDSNGFAGHFDGNGKTISGVYMYNTGSDKIFGYALLGTPHDGAYIGNFVLTNSMFDYDALGGWGGAVLGTVYGEVTIENVYVDKTVYVDSAVGGAIGGLVGALESGADLTVNDCVFAGTVNDYSNGEAGGIIGSTNSQKITVTNCLFTGSVTGKNKVAGIGGGTAKSGSVISNCISIGTVTSSDEDNAHSISAKGGAINDSYYVGTSATETATMENVVELDDVLGSLVGTDATITIEGWTKRAGDIMVPSGVAAVAPSTAADYAKEYTVKWMNGTEELASESYKYGETPSYKGTTPTKAEDEYFTYTFKGWTPEIVAVVGEATYVAEFNSVRKPSAGDDIDPDAIEITSVDEWMLFVDGKNVDKNGDYKYPNAKFVITADVLDFTGRTLTPIVGFNGELDGRGVTLKNITMTKADAGEVALFCELGAATVKNFVIESSSFTGTEWVGTVACCVKGPSLIQNVYVASDVTVVSTKDTGDSKDCASAGGIVGGCFSDNDGTVPAVTVKDCVFAGTVSGKLKAIGGIVGNGNSTDGKLHNIVIENCLVLGSVSSDGKPDTSGFVGGNNGASVTITNSIYAGMGFNSYPFGKAATFTAINCYTIQLDVDGMAYCTNGVDAIEGVTLVTSLVEALVGTDATLTLDGWTKRAGDVMVPTGVADFALSTADEFEKTYTITWKNGEEILATEEYKYGETPTFKGETPTKASDDTYDYTFVNWTPSVGSVVGDATYYAEFIKTRKNVVLEDEEDEGNTDNTQKPADTTPETEAAPAPETEATSGGCGGSIGIAGVAMLALVSGAALVIKKKED